MNKRLIILGLLIISLAGRTQTAVTNTGILYITSSSDIFFAANNFTNNAGAALTNNGQLYIQGNLTNNQASMTVGTGTLFLNGSLAQSVAGTAQFKTYNLNTNNSSGITLNNDLSVTGIHTFVAGTIASSVTPNYLFYEAGSSYTGSSDAAHVTGWVKKYGSTAFVFPVGNTSYLRSIAIGNLSASSEFNAVYSGATTNTSNLQSPLIAINPGEYWTLNKISGGTAEVTLNWDNSKVHFPNYVLTDIRSAQYTSSKWTNTGGSATGSTATTGTVTSSALSTMGQMSIGSVSFVVPLYFLNVFAKKSSSYTLVEWQTTNEVNVQQHEVQRSINNIEFTTAGTIAARNILDAQTYDFYDSNNDFNGTIYYRIKSVDIDGRIKYSKVVSVSFNTLNDEISLKNNPVTNTINLSVSNNSNTLYQYTLISTNGVLVQQGSVKYNGVGSFSIPLAQSITPGSYILLIKTAGKIFNKKLIVR